MMMVKEQAAICLEKLKEAKTFDADPEAAHALADQAILEFLEAIGCEELVAAFNDIEMWYA